MTHIQPGVINDANGIVPGPSFNFGSTLGPNITVTDNFLRADGALGGFWSPVIQDTTETMYNALTGGIQIVNHGFGPIASGGGDASSLVTGYTFNNDQWAQARIKTIDPGTATLNITDAVFSGGGVTYTYTIASGSIAAAIAGNRMAVRVAGMAHAGNNGNFQAVAANITGTTFAVGNASGVTATETGTGYCPSDCGAGVMVRASGNSAATLNAYIFHVGTNSFTPGVIWQGRVAYYELWKVVNGVGTAIGLVPNPDLIITLPSPGDVIAITAIGTAIKAYVNGYLLFSVTDSAIASGVPGIHTFCISGQNEYLWENWNTVVNPPGNNGTTYDTFTASDIGAPSFSLPSTAQTATDPFTYANGNLNTANPNWVQQTGTFTINTNRAFGSAAGNSNAYRSDVAAVADQYATVTAVVNGTAATQNCGPAVRMSTSAQTFYGVQYASATFRIIKCVTGTVTAIANFDASAPVTGDTVTIIVRGNMLYALKNGVLVGSFLDYNSIILTGRSGIWNAGNSTTNGFDDWTCGTVS